MKVKYTDEELIEAVKSSNSINGVLQKIGLKFSGTTHTSVKTKIKKLRIDTSHFTGQGWCKGEKHDQFVKKFVECPLKTVLVKNSTYVHANGLKKKLLKAGLLEDKCYNCGITEWLNEDITLQIHHIDGNRTNNLLSNLTILCPNCHSQTPNYCGRNRGLKRTSETLDKDMVVRVEPSILKKFKRACFDRQKTMSEVIRDLMLRYIRQE